MLFSWAVMDGCDVLIASRLVSADWQMPIASEAEGLFAASEQGFPASKSSVTRSGAFCADVADASDMASAAVNSDVRSIAIPLAFLRHALSAPKSAVARGRNRRLLGRALDLAGEVLRDLARIEGVGVGP